MIFSKELLSRGNSAPEAGGSSSSSTSSAKMFQNRKEFFPIALKQSHPLMHNGIAKIYNQFPNAFGNLNEMRDYLQQVHEMGFNVVWINPIQKVGTKMFERSSNQSGLSYNVQGSVYATKNFSQIDERYIDGNDIRDGEDIQAAGKRQLRAFTDQAKQLGIVPIFDLVLNHVAADNEDLASDHPEWLSGKPSIFMDVKQFDYSDPEKSRQILEQHWKPYVKKYMEEYGFMGVRVDNVASMRFEGCHMIRKSLYEYMHTLVDIPVIFDELLFSREDMDETIRKLILENGSNPTHVTGSLFYASVGESRRKLGQIMSARGNDLSHEMGMKSKMVFEHKGGDGSTSVNPHALGGVVNFTGNHDVYSLGYCVAMDMREQYFLAGKYQSDMERTIGYIYCRIQKILEIDGEDKDKSEFENLKKKIMYLCHKNNIPPLDPSEYSKNLREKVALQAFVSSGGFYFLAGDESADMSEKSVFMKLGHAHKKEKSVLRPGEGMETIPDTRYHALIDTLLEYDESYYIVEGKIRERDGIYQKMQKGEQNLTKQFSRATNAIHKEKQAIREKLMRIIPNIPSESPDFNYGRGALVGKEDLRPFLAEVNGVLSRFPKTELGMFSKVIYLPEKPDLLVVLRTNGTEFKTQDTRADLVVVHLDPQRSVELTSQDLHSIYMGFEGQVGKPFDGSYNHASRSHLHLVGGIENKTEKKSESHTTSFDRGMSG